MQIQWCRPINKRTGVHYNFYTFPLIKISIHKPCTGNSVIFLQTLLLLEAISISSILNKVKSDFHEKKMHVFLEYLFCVASLTALVFVYICTPIAFYIWAIWPFLIRFWIINTAFPYHRSY